MPVSIARTEIFSNEKNIELMKPSVVIICGGGPAPGINTVIATVAKAFLADDYRVLGVQHGYQGLFSEDPEM